MGIKDGFVLKEYGVRSLRGRQMGHPGGETPTEPRTVTVPDWIATDWRIAVTGAFHAVSFLVVLGFLVLIIGFLGDLIRGDGAPSLGSILITPLATALYYLGGYDGAPIMVTGVVFYFVALRWSLRRITLPAERTRVVTLSPKIALSTIVMLLLIAGVADLLSLTPARVPGSRSAPSSELLRPDYIRIVFLLLPVTTVVAFVATAKVAHQSVAQVLGLSKEGLTWLPAAAVGVRTALKIAVLGLIPIYALGFTLQFMSETRFDSLPATLIELVFLVMLLGGLDISALYGINSMAFLQVEGFGRTLGWQWVGVLVIAAAFFFAGRRAAHEARARTMFEAISIAPLVGLLIALGATIVAIDYTTLAGAEGLVAPAMLLPIVWSLVSAGGAWYFAREQALPSGVVVSTREAPTSTPTMEAEQDKPTSG